MSDIVERLHSFAAMNCDEVEIYQYDHACDVNGHIASEAAAEITRLRILVQHSCLHWDRQRDVGGWFCPTCGARGLP